MNDSSSAVTSFTRPSSFLPVNATNITVNSETEDNTGDKQTKDKMSKGQFKANLLKSIKLSSDEPGKISSPKVSRRAYQQTNIKITQNEVEEKLKNMELKRMSRLGVAVVDQSDLSGGRHTTVEECEESNVNGYGENKMKTSFKHAVEEVSRQSKGFKTESTEIETAGSKNKEGMARNKPSGTKKFINKFNCVVKTDAIASAGYNELEQDVYSKRNDMEQKKIVFIEEGNDSSETQLKFTNALQQSNSSDGKTIAIERTEAVPPDLILTTPGLFKDNVDTTKLKMDTEIPKIITKVRNIVKEQTIRLGAVHTDDQETPVVKKVFRQKQKHSNIQRNSGDSFEPIRGPLPPLRHFTRQEKVFKKLQRCCKSIDEILKDNLVVDSDEIDDLRTTLDEANVFLAEYQSKLKVLEEKVTPKLHDKQTLCVLKSKLNVVKDDIKNFRGLKRDSRYIQLCTILSNFYLDINNIFNKFEQGNGREELLREVDICIKDLEVKATRNEETLFEILTEQVESIENKHFASINK